MKIKGLRWWIIGLIFLATVINYIDRTALSVMWPGISEELGFTKNDYAIMLNVFMVAYALGQSLSGRMFDKVGTRMGYVISIMVWGASTALHAVARGMLSFSVFRVMLGLSEAGNWPGAVKSNAEWFPVKERAIAQGIFNAGASMGSVIAPPLIAMLYVGFGWRMTFMIVGSLVVLWVIPWLIINKATPNKHPWITDEERDFIMSDRQEDKNIPEEEEQVLSLKEIMSHKESWAVLVSRFFLEPIWWLFVGWMPIYLADKYGFDVKEIGFFAWVPYVGAAIGSLSGGWFSGRMISSTGSVDKARKTTITIGAVLMFLGLIATILMANTPEKFVGIVAVVLFGFQFSISNVQTLPSDLFSGKSVGTLAGFGGTIGVISVILMNFLIPIITTESYTPAFIAIALFVPLGVISIYVLCKKIEPVKIKK
ncbi:hexuronate transporter ExuT [Echinicola pacifica]|uniref:Hexuronate transporter ExuT n=1 Tax=Echinicola pacifica TaxID=346377 RepID=A0A918PUR9_9BACT|nr:MFS transporter [Echinicola pacifica]GGZ23564.1 hexuronate transporter ExuT [Echinicola pacifica]